MKFIFGLILALTSVQALACLPKGDQLNSRRKYEFSNDLRRRSRACWNQIKRGLGEINSGDVAVFKRNSLSQEIFSIVGRFHQTEVRKVYEGGGSTFHCEPVTPKKRC